jgi:hypothetical protein
MVPASGQSYQSFGLPMAGLLCNCSGYQRLELPMVMATNGKAYNGYSYQWLGLPMAIAIMVRATNGKGYHWG